MNNGRHNFLLASCPAKVALIILTETSIVEEGPAIHPLFSDLNGLIWNDAIFHVQIVWHFHFTDLFTINSGKLRIHLDPIWEEGINGCRKGLEINHGVVLDINVKVILEHLTDQFRPLVVILLSNGKGRIQLLVIVILIFWICLLAYAINMYQSIPHEADQFHLAVLVVDIDDHDRVRSRLRRAFPYSTICSQDQDIDPVFGLLTVEILFNSWLGVGPTRFAIQAFNKHKDHSTKDQQEENGNPL